MTHPKIVQLLDEVRVAGADEAQVDSVVAEVNKVVDEFSRGEDYELALCACRVGLQAVDELRRSSSKTDRLYSVLLRREGDVLGADGQHLAGLRRLRSSLTHQQRSRDESEQEVERGVGVILNSIAEICFGRGHARFALRIVRRSRKTFERLALTEKTGARDLIYTVLLQAKIEGSLQLATAVETYRTAIRLDERRLSAHPRSTECKEDLAWSWECFGTYLEGLSRFREALDAYERAIKLLHPPWSRETKDVVLSLREDVGHVLTRCGEFDNAVEALRDVLTEKRLQLSQQDGGGGLLTDVADLHDALACALRLGGHPRQAASHSIRALRTFARVGEVESAVESALDALSTARLTRGTSKLWALVLARALALLDPSASHDSAADRDLSNMRHELEAAFAQVGAPLGKDRLR